MSFITVTLFGGLRVAVDDRPVSLPYDKVRALLAYLLVEAPRPQRRETLAGLLWPEQTERQARHSLSQALLKLRKAVDPHNQLILADRHSIGLDPQVEIDVDTAVFTTLLEQCRLHDHTQPALCEPCMARRETAVVRYAGPLLAGLSLPDTPVFEQWLTRWRQQFHQRLMSALAALVSGCEQRGNWTAAIRYAQQQLAQEPWLEETHLRLMMLYARSGQRSRALKQFEQCKIVLQQELNASVSPETAILARQIELRPNFSLQNLPVSPAPFIGREKEITTLTGWLEDGDARLITLTGMGGVGKTRTSLAVARRFLHPQTTQPVPPFADGVYFVDLVPLRAPEQLEAAVAEALALTLPPDGSRRQLLDYFGDKRMLLLFDNFEHITAAASFVSELLKAAPHVAIIVTSRTRLRLRGEKVLSLYGLATAPAGEDAATTTAAAQLFVVAAQQLLPNLSCTTEEYGHIAEICRLVEGVPLAIELAAQWVDILPMASIASELASGMAPLQAEIADLPIRQRSMEAVFSTSWRRLSPSARAVLARLSVFRGGFTLEAATTIAGASQRTLAHLVTHSMIRFSPVEQRYHCHELLRQYAAARLREDLQRVRETRRRHLAFFRRMAEQGGRALRGGDVTGWMRRFKFEQGNFDAAFEWGLVNQIEEAAQTAVGLHLYYFITGKMVLGQELYAKFLRRKASLSTPDYGWVLTWYTSMIWVQGKLEEAQKLAEEAALLFAELDDSAGVIMSHHHRSIAAFYRGDLETAAFHSDQAIALARIIADASPWFLTVCLQGRSTFLAEMGEEEAAYQTSAECLQLSRATGNLMASSYAMSSLARHATRRGDLAEANAFSQQALAIARDLNDRRMEGIQYLVLGNIDLAQRDFAAAVGHLEVAVAIADDIISADVLDEALMLLGDAYRGTAQYVQALPIFIRWAQLSRQLNHAANTAASLAKIANVCWQLQPGSLQPVRWLAAVAAWRAANPSGEHPTEEKWRAAMRAQVSGRRFEAAWEAGRHLTVDQALAETSATWETFVGT